MSGLKKTPLFHNHQKRGAKIVPFAGWELPVRFSGIVEEHRATREAATIFDVSHMGEILVEGPEAERALNYLCSNDVRSLADGRAQYSALLNEKGGVVDDLLIYRYTTEKYLLCVNASNADKDYAWIQERNKHQAEFRNVSEIFGQIALQGPRAVEIFCKLVPAGSVSPFAFKEFTYGGSTIIAARTGYTGEDGFEIFVPVGITEKLWDALLEVGAPFGILPAGLGARDSLRLEACYSLHGHELSEEVSALEAGISWIVKLEKDEFIGREALLAQKKRGIARRRIGFFVEETGIVREGAMLFDEKDRHVGQVTSGTLTPTLNRALGLAIVEQAAGHLDAALWAEVRGKRIRCRVVKTPFYKR